MLIAEMACAHDGSDEAAKRILEDFSSTGIDAVQYQVWKADSLLSPERNDYIKIKNLEIPIDSWRSLVKFHRSNFPKLQLSIFVYDEFGATFAEEAQPDLVKFNSSDLTNPFLLDWVAETKFPLNLSWGGSTIREVEWAFERLSSRGYDCHLLTLMNGLQSFPSEPDQSQLLLGKKIADLFGVRAGYQDHSPGGSQMSFLLNTAALSLGYTSLETHVCSSRAQTSTDFESALEPHEMKALKLQLDAVATALDSNNVWAVDPRVTAYRQFQKKYLCAAVDLEAGHEITFSDLILLRTDQVGFGGMDLEGLVGQRLKVAVKKGQMLNKEVLW